MSQGQDSDNDFERPKDDFIFYHNAFKTEEKKMVTHQKFEEVTTKYWELLRQMPEQDLTKPTISKKQYIQLVSRMYKVLLPLYRVKEMENEIEQEWVMDSRGQEELSFNLLTKVLFRIAHSWATNIDLDEYVELLSKIFDRIIIVTQIMANYSSYQTSQPTFIIRVSFPAEEKKIQEAKGKDSKANLADEWLECRSDESNRSDFEYKYEEDPENMVVKKFKRNRQEGLSPIGRPGLGGAQVNNVVPIKEPFYYQEDVLFNFDDFSNQDFKVYSLRPIEQIVPFGYATVHFLKTIKTEVQYQLVLYRQSHLPAAYHNMSPQELDQTSRLIGFEDSGLIPNETGAVTTEYFPRNDMYEPRNLTGCFFHVQISDICYNHYRRILKDGNQFSVRMYQSLKSGRAKPRSGLNNQEPITEVNKTGYNPALDRRAFLKLQDDGQNFSNTYYMIEDTTNEMYYRMDINKIETKGKLCIKDNEEVKKDEEFNHVETSYKRLRQIMLFKKFEAIFTDRAAADNKEQMRLKKLIEKEDKRRLLAMKHATIAQKGLSETHEEKSFIKMMRGPFYQLDSRDGLQQDHFETCAEGDLIQAAKTSALKILVIGKPRAGKTCLAKNLATKLDLVHISVEGWLNALINKIKTYEPPEDLEEGQAPPKWLTDLEETVNQQLLSGGGPNDDQIFQIYEEQVNSALATLKGFILDISYYPREQSWASSIRQRYLLGQPDKIGRMKEFSHIVELWCDDDEIKLRTQNLRVNPDDNVVYSKWEREERKKPKPVVEGEEEVDEENQIKPFDENALFQRTCDTDEQIKEELHYYNTVERPAMEELLINFYDNQYIKLDSAGLTPDELTDAVTCRVKPDDDLPLRPLAILIEGGGDFKSLLTEGLEENQLPRKWSLWKQTDPVALAQGKVVQGLPEYAAHYNGNVFVFSTEENLKAFISAPKKYLEERPVMPSNFRILMLGPKGVGQHTQASALSETYGWRIVDFKQVVRDKLEELMRYEIHIPNNPVPGGRIGLSEQELQEVIEGKAIPAWKYIPWIFDFLGYPLEKKKPPPPEEKQEEENQEEEAPPVLTEQEMKKKMLEDKKKREEEERRRKEDEEKEKAKEDRRRRRQEALDQGLNPVEMGIEDSEEEPVIIEDLNIDQLVLKFNEETGKAPFVGGFILVGFPETEVQIQKLKEHGLEFDRIIYLNDTNEEPGEEIKKRMTEVELYDWDWELENSQKILNLAKENLGEEIVREISCNGKIEEVTIRIRNEIDPFYLKVDNADDVRVSADLSEEDKKLPKGDFGDYCPVTYVKDNWIVRGNPEQEVTIFGKTYWLAGEKEAEVFKFNPVDFLNATRNTLRGPPILDLPPPRIMVLGHRGAGVTSQIRMLCEKYKLEEFNLKEEYLNKLKEEKEKRKRRRLLDRGFRPPQPAEEEGMEPPPDPEIEEDPEDFDRETHEREVMKIIYDSSKGYVIDGTWRELPEGAVSQSLQDLLFESRRVPEIVVILKCKEKATFDRIINRDAIRAEYTRLMEARDAEKKRQREEDRVTYINEIRTDEEKTQEEIQEMINTWDDNRDTADKEADENDPEMPNYEAMEQVERDKLVEQRTNDDGFFEEFSTVLKDKQVFVIDDIKTDMSADFVNIKILDRIKENLVNRKDLIEKQLAQPLTVSDVKFHEQSYIYRHSKYGQNSPLDLSNPAKTKANAVLYRERLYFLTDKDQQQRFLKEPSRYTTSVETVPLDINIKPRVFILGLPKSGKTTLCKQLSEKTGIVHLKMSKIIAQFVDRDSQQFKNLRTLMKIEGRQIEDDQLINLLLKRIQFKDCQAKGWILEDFPKTRTQAIFLAKRGLVPTQVINMKIPGDQVMARTAPLTETKFGCNRVIFEARLRFFLDNTPNIFSFYQRFYGNVVEIDGLKSKWFISERALTSIQQNMQARQNFARDYFLREVSPRPCKIRNLNYDRNLVKQSISQEFRYYCPVTWKNEKLLVKCSQNTDDCVLYKNCFYFFKGTQERDMFVQNPSRFIMNVALPRLTDLPLRFLPHKAAEVMLLEKALNGHCAVTLMDEERVKRGDALLLIVYREHKFIFDSEFKLQRFLANPFKYQKASLPVKMPPPEDKISLFNLQKMDDSIAFMEQALGQVVTRGLREVSENRLKHPGMSVKETMLKLFALFLKTENPANTEYMKKKYAGKMKLFIQRCELPEEIYDLATDKDKKKAKTGEWPEFKENYYNTRGADYDYNLSQIQQEATDNFANYIR